MAKQKKLSIGPQTKTAKGLEKMYFEFRDGIQIFQQAMSALDAQLITAYELTFGKQLEYGPSPEAQERVGEYVSLQDSLESFIESITNALPEELSPSKKLDELYKLRLEYASKSRLLDIEHNVILYLRFGTVTELFRDILERQRIAALTKSWDLGSDKKSKTRSKK